MKRSQINTIINDAAKFMKSNGFNLPPYAFWTIDDWRANKESCKEITSVMMGWDITDYGLGRFNECGLVLFTLRNGIPSDKTSKPYAEKIMISRQNQIAPMHYHNNKVEDIINRSGATLAIELYNHTPDNELADTDVTVNSDGRLYNRKAGHIVKLAPGESITLPQGQYHKFWGYGGDVLVGEVSTINDDNTDNVFFEKVGRFPEIEEDEEPQYLLVCDYDKFI
ncbi:MAG: D-lyxose/D-mannose family sugar isomerase [Spirochaetes bacterium]|nr:D-lyxose/D-mannose family sugar isomerase [Spirochaetota bacterium]MBN2772012.1 D-lyxose/D-mannose family sugar isomerase [Spirochaetota bacterium]